VYWQIWPDRQGDANGLRLEIRGTHEHSVQTPVPGCPRCQRVYARLERIAQQIIPRDRKGYLFEISPFSPVLTVQSGTGGRLDVSVGVLIYPEAREPTDIRWSAEPLREMESKLERLGAQKGRWVEA
jgi:hypothetical protein